MIAGVTHDVLYLLLLLYYYKGPILFSALYSWTCRQPTHGLVSPYLTFYILGAISLLGSLLLIWVSPSTNVEKGSLVEKMKKENADSSIVCYSVCWILALDHQEPLVV